MQIESGEETGHDGHRRKGPASCDSLRTTLERPTPAAKEEAIAALSAVRRGGCDVDPRENVTSYLEAELAISAPDGKTLISFRETSGRQHVDRPLRARKGRWQRAR